MNSAISDCPVCGEPIEATVKVYLSDVVVKDGKIVSFHDSSEGGLGVELNLYCPNDHEGDIAEAVGDHPSAVTLNGTTYQT